VCADVGFVSPAASLVAPRNGFWPEVDCSIHVDI